MFEVIELGGMKTVNTESACNHVYIVDVSYSMSYDLPEIRQHLKNIITMVAKPNDTFSVVYFSGRGQCGIVFENVLVSDPSTISHMHKTIDRFINPIGLTGFADPLDLVMSLKLDATKVNNLIMMTDGYDNQTSRSVILDKAKNLSSKYQNVSFIEYGYYADRDLLRQMAEASNGTHVFAEGYNRYEQVLEAAVETVARAPNTEVSTNKRAKDCIYLYQDQIRISPVTDGKATVPSDVERVYSIVPGDVLNKQLSEDHLYMILYYAGVKEHDELVWNTLQRLGDVNLVEMYTNAFTKQEISDFVEEVNECVLNEKIRFVKGKDLSAVPDKKTPTVIDLLEILSAADATLVTSSPYWNYNRISRERVAKEELPKFIPDPKADAKITDIVFSSERPNASIQTVMNGTVKLPDNEFGLKSVESNIFRNYTIVKDGIVNSDVLPVTFNSKYVVGLEAFPHEVISSGDGREYWQFNLRSIPVINRSMVEKLYADVFVDTIAKQQALKIKLKTINYILKEREESLPMTTGPLIDKYGVKAAKWLSDIGVREYGFSPVGTTSAEVSDEYPSVQVEVKIKGLSSIPSVKDVLKRVDDNKSLNNLQAMVHNGYVYYDKHNDADLGTAKTELTKMKRGLDTQIANMVYSLILGRKWFSDDEVFEADIKIGDFETTMTAQKVRKMIKI